MLEKLRNFGIAAKNLVLYIFVPVAFFIGYIAYLLNKNRELSDEVQTKEGEEKLNETKSEQKRIDDRAIAAVAEYQRLRADYLRSSVEKMRRGGSGTEGSDSDQGPENLPDGSGTKDHGDGEG